MGLGASTASEQESEKIVWLVNHDGYASPWAQFVLRRYGSGLAATGMALNSSLPWLLRQRMQDWNICGITVELGPSYVSFGRTLGCERGDDSGPGMFYGITIRFGDHGSGGWLWYCKPREWLLQLHKAVIEPVPASAPSESPTGIIDEARVRGSSTVQPRWPGRGRHLFEEADESNGQSSTSTTAPSSSTGTPETREGDTKETEEGGSKTASAEQAEPITNQNAVEHQLSMYLSNADGHIGLLCLPVPSSCRQKIDEVMPLWKYGCEVPFASGTQLLTTARDFSSLRESAMNMPDLLLFGLEADLASSLTPDWTWEKYPRGFGEVTVANYPNPSTEEIVSSSNGSSVPAPEKEASES